MARMVNLQARKPRRVGNTKKQRGVRAKKTVLITGAASGFGTYLAETFAHAGYNLVVHAREKKKLTRLQSAIIKKEHVRCSTVIADIRNSRGLGALQKALSAHRVHILINNAGINPELGSDSTVSDVSNINDIVLTNMSAAIALSTSAFEYFKVAGGGIIININSIAGLRGNYHESVYSASKFGLRGFSESVKDAWLKHGVKMIDVYSGALSTGMSATRPDVEHLIDPQELAEFLVGLCTTESFFVRDINVQR